jgi:hypothetical protein
MSISLNTAVVAMHTFAFKFQENKRLSVSIPLTLKASVSPIKSKITAAVRSTMIFPATSATFYKAAGIMCNEDIEIQSYETKANATSGHDHASQVFTTINHFQLDFFLEENLSKGVTCNWQTISLTQTLFELFYLANLQSHYLL